MPRESRFRLPVSPRRLCVGSLILVGCVFGAEASLRAGNEQRQVPSRDDMPVYRAGVELVVLNVAVLDEDGEPVVGLSADDFRLMEDGQLQEITLFATSEETPLDVALVLDTSGSIRENAPSVRDDAMAFLEALGPHDCVYFVPFQQYVGPAAWARPDAPLLAAIIGGMELEGGTALYDALYEGLSSVDRSRYRSAPRDERGWREVSYDGESCGAALPPRGMGIPNTVRRTAVVVLSDGGDEHSLATYADTVVNAWSDPAPIFPVAIGDALAPRRNRPLRPGTLPQRWYLRRRDFARELQNRLEYLAHITGGRLIVGDERDDVREEFATVITMLRSSYMVGYRPPPDAEATPRGGLVWHRVGLETTRDDVEIFVRPGYYRRLVDTRGAEEFVRDGVRVLEEGNAEDAVEQLDLAARLDPGYWPLYLVRARALLQMGFEERARDDLLRVVAMRPGNGNVHALLARTAHGLGEYDLAWHHAIRAHQDDAAVTALLRALQDVSSPPADLVEQLRAVRLFVDVAPIPDALDQGTMLTVLQVLRRQISDAADVALVTARNIADAGLIVAVRKVEGEPRKLEGHLVMNLAPFQEWRREELEIDDLDDPVSVAEGVQEALEKARRRLRGLR